MNRAIPLHGLAQPEGRPLLVAWQTKDFSSTITYVRGLLSIGLNDRLKYLNYMKIRTLFLLTLATCAMMEITLTGWHTWDAKACPNWQMR